ncbi:MAG: hypothetical protein NZ961_25100, partial [Candidatus Poribacteria bacterium]|nr:hypothetical protein [Candidatus Poribacteria bacterium]
RFCQGIRSRSRESTNLAPRGWMKLGYRQYRGFRYGRVFYTDLSIYSVRRVGAQKLAREWTEKHRRK